MNGGNARPGSRIRRPQEAKNPGRNTKPGQGKDPQKPQAPTDLKHPELEVDLTETKPRPKPQKPKPGTRSESVLVGEDELQDTLRLAATRQAFGPKMRVNANRQVVWSVGPNELAIIPGAIDVQLADGRMHMSVPVNCEELPNKVEVPLVFAVGSKKRSAGLLATTAAVPDKMEEPVAIWAESVIAFAWNVLLDSIVMLAEGDDADGDPLAPISMTASKGMLEIGVGARSRRSKDRTIDATGSARQRTASGALARVRR